MLAFFVILSITLLSVSISVDTEVSLTESIVEFTPGNITSNLKEWESDVAIMFYAPWCTYCKQLKPTWATIAALKLENKDVAVGMFDCEASNKHIDVCRDFEIDRYPTLAFIGYGNLNQAEGGALLGTAYHQRIVRYIADLYPEAVYDWVNVLCFLSGWNRKWDDFIGFFTGKSRVIRQLERNKVRMEAAEKKAELFSQELERYKANELFDAIEDHGDPFPQLHSLEPDEGNLALRVCVAEMAGEYCRYYPEDRYCAILDRCALQQLSPQVRIVQSAAPLSLQEPHPHPTWVLADTMVASVCRPERCPFDNERGCRVVSVCMQPSVMQQYKAALAEGDLI